MPDDLTTELLAMERRGWDALCDGTAAEFYGEVMTDDGTMVLGNGAVLDRDAVVAALRGSPPWLRYEIDAVRLVRAGAGAAAIAYTGRAWREEGASPFVGAMTSLYVRDDGGWRLALYTQTPVP
jgi:uncharacterized protein (TIGR02246 family)